MRSFIFQVFALFALALPAFAALPGSRDTTNPEFMARPYSQTYRDCMARSVSTMEMVDCMENERKSWDQRLNKVWKETLSSVMSPLQWRDAQRKWLAFRDSQCLAVTGKGSGGATDSASCMMNMTIERTLQLEDANWPLG